MLINFKEGNILEASTQVVVNTVNCEGFMGKGFALQFKKKYPEMFKEYSHKCEEGKIAIGQLHLYKGSPRYWILNFPTKNHWRNKSKLEYIEKESVEFKTRYVEWGITSIAFPRLGCQLGGLDWNLAELPGVRIEIFSHSSNCETARKKACLVRN